MAGFEMTGAAEGAAAEVPGAREDPGVAGAAEDVGSAGAVVLTAVSVFLQVGKLSAKNSGRNFEYLCSKRNKQERVPL